MISRKRLFFVTISSEMPELARVIEALLELSRQCCLEATAESAAQTEPCEGLRLALKTKNPTAAGFK